MIWHWQCCALFCGLCWESCLPILLSIDTPQFSLPNINAVKIRAQREDVLYEEKYLTNVNALQLCGLDCVWAK